MYGYVLFSYVAGGGGVCTVYLEGSSTFLLFLAAMENVKNDILCDLFVPHGFRWREKLTGATDGGGQEAVQCHVM